VELLLGVHRALEAVVDELAGVRNPDGVGVGVRPVDVVPDLLGDGVVEPGDDAGVNLEPLGVVNHGRGIDSAIDVTEETKFLEGEFHGGTPLPEIAFVGREHDWDMAANVE
jgi:hypothetical protein